jgi:hypothetical protein
MRQDPRMCSGGELVFELIGIPERRRWRVVYFGALALVFAAAIYAALETGLLF